MKLCSQCGGSPLPFFMAGFIATFSAFLTWLTLSYSQFDLAMQILGCGLIFVAVGGTVLHYMFGCMKRHCLHARDAKYQHGIAHQ